MEEVKNFRKEIISYLETADDKTVRMIHAMLEVDAEEDWWDQITTLHKEAKDKG